jgi:PAS domain-containing protein
MTYHLPDGVKGEDKMKMPVQSEQSSSLYFAAIRARLAEFERARLDAVPLSRALLEAEDLAGAVVSRPKDAIFIGTHDGKFADAKELLTDLLGYRVEDMVRRDIRSICVNPVECDKLMQEMDLKGFIIDHPIKLLKSDGTELPCCITATVRAYKKDFVCSGLPLFKAWVRETAIPI